ncbi:copper amine oxidase N-terminal domain-containing protein [Heliobacterium chlorum]|uniref:Copper amine oxidase N-terminal domain-containing protein n=1 Tax=Heliobacterium chlorum TaxID=2698 RepID=A0ABR7SYT9_HELCL|nr:copper amine oxidase N-terminal domain-containing protein [Heliobacterium chlorum]MBC9782903.1 copper amine oxidase N-terminal domain-containing protein [Heliobacterium chlorum]
MRRAIARYTLGLAAMALLCTLALSASEARYSTFLDKKTSIYEPTIVLNGLPMIFEPAVQLERGYILAPLRPLAEALGAEVTYDKEKRRAIVRRENLCLEVQANSLEEKWRPWEKGLRVSGTIVDDHMLVPVQWLASHLADGWFYDEKNQRALLRGGTPWRDDDYIAFARWAEILRLRVRAADERASLSQRGLEPSPPIKKEKDLERFLGAYWSSEQIKIMWENSRETPSMVSDEKINPDFDPTTVLRWRVLSRSPEEVQVETVFPVQGGFMSREQKVLYIIQPDEKGALKIKERRLSGAVDSL